MEKIDLAVVFYEKEIDILTLLVKSLELHCDTSLVDKIYFINNAVNQSEGREAFESKILPLFKTFKDAVSVVDAVTLGVQHNDGANPYIAQQALKLSIATLSDKNHYLVLDAKNHLIRKLRRNDLFTEDGKPISHLQIHGGYLKTCLEESCKYFEVDVDTDKQVLPTVTPYLMITSLVRELLEEVKKREGTGIYELILKNDKLTEFLLYFAYLTYRGGKSHFYGFEPKPYATLFTRWPESENDIKRVLDSTLKGGVWTFSVHSKRFEQLKSNEIDFISNLWVDRGLFNNVDSAKKFIKRQVNPPTSPSQEITNAAGDGKVVEGRNKRLFIANDSNEVIKQHRGEKLLNYSQVKAWRRIIETRYAFCAAKGISYRLMVVPDAHAVHKEDLPQLDNISAKRPINQITSELYDHSYISYPLEELVDAANTGESYHPVDSHYTAYGAYVCYKRIIKDLRINIPSLTDNEVEFIPKKGTGDLGEKFEPHRTAEYTECVVKQGTAKKVWNNAVTNRGHMSVWVNAKTSLPTCILFTDSYGWKIQRFLAESFSKLFIIHSPLLEHEAIDFLKPDVVVSLMAERFLIYTPKDIFDKSAMQFADEKGGDIKSYEEIRSVSNVQI
jgi:alginate O-acetyltransferase complex protein AlgJ